MSKIKAALLNRNGEVIGEVFDAPEKGSSIDLAGCFTVNGDPVNVKSMNISRSVKNIKKAKFEQPVSKVGSVYTFNCVEENNVVY